MPNCRPWIQTKHVCAEKMREHEKTFILESYDSATARSGKGS